MSGVLPAIYNSLLLLLGHSPFFSGQRKFALYTQLHHFPMQTSPLHLRSAWHSFSLVRGRSLHCIHNCTTFPCRLHSLYNLSLFSLASIENLELEVAAESSVRVMWLPPALPVGVSILQFRVYYHDTLELQGSDDEQKGVQILQTMQPDVTTGELSPDRQYRFEVVGVYLEADGEVYEEGRRGGEGRGNSSEIFVPGESNTLWFVSHEYNSRSFSSCKIFSRLFPQIRHYFNLWQCFPCSAKNGM